LDLRIATPGGVIGILMLPTLSRFRSHGMKNSTSRARPLGLVRSSEIMSRLGVDCVLIPSPVGQKVVPKIQPLVRIYILSNLGDGMC
jgi:hypothetical protein